MIAGRSITAMTFMFKETDWPHSPRLLSRIPTRRSRLRETEDGEGASRSCLSWSFDAGGLMARGGDVIPEKPNRAPQTSGAGNCRAGTQ